MTRYTLYLPNTTIEALRKRSKDSHIVVSELIRMALDKFLKEEKNK